MTKMATARAMQAADRARLRRWRQKHKLKVVPIEVSAELPVCPAEKEPGNRRYRTISLEERIALGNEIATKILLAEHQIELWQQLQKRLWAFPDELQWAGVRIIGPALAKAKEIAASQRVFYVTYFGDLDWGATVTDARQILAASDYVAPLVALLGFEILPSMRAKLKLFS